MQSPERTTLSLNSLQYLRALAALMVVASHVAGYADPSGWAVAHGTALLGGVDLFFVISGFVMWTSTADRPITPRTFYRLRLVRIAPLYWIVTSVLVIAMLRWPSLLRSGTFDPAHVLASYAFLAWPHPGTGVMFPVLVPGWTLNYEMFFYLGFGLLLLLPIQRRLPMLLLGALGLAASHWMLGPANPWAAFYTDPIILEFAAGTALGCAFLRTRANGGSAAALILGAGLVLLIALPSLFDQTLPRDILSGIPAVLVIGGAVWAERAWTPRVRPWLKRLGDASYSIYLVHPMVLSGLGQAWRKLGITQPAGAIVFAVIAIATVTAMGLLVHGLVERPLLRGMRSLYRTEASTEERHAARPASPAQPMGAV